MDNMAVVNHEARTGSVSLSLKLILTIGPVVLLGCCISWYMLISSEKNHLLQNAVNYTASYSDLIRKSVRYDMLTSQREAIQRVVEDIGSKDGIERVRIFDPRGGIVYSSLPSETGTSRSRVSAACSGCHVLSAQPRQAEEKQWKISQVPGGPDMLIFAAPIYNEPSCYTAACHIHNKRTKVIGVLETGFSLRGLDKNISEQTGYITVYAAAFLIVTSFLIGLILYAVVQKPMSTISKGMKKAAAGDLAHKVKVDSKDEIGLLAATFNEMTERLERTTVSRDALAREIEERRRVQEELSRSEMFMNTAFDSIYDPFVIIDRDYRIVRANAAFAEMRGIALGDLAGRKCHEILYKEKAVCEKCIAGIAFRSALPCADQQSITLQSGLEASYEVYAYPITGEDGCVSHVIEYFHDITDRRLAERAAKFAYMELDQIFNTAADGMCVIDRNFSVTRINKTFLSMFGLEMAEAVGKKCYEIFRSKECDTPDCPLTCIAGEQKLFMQFESERIRKDGLHFPCLVYATAFRGHDGEIIGVVEDLKDISEIKEMEDELRSLSLTDELTGLYNRRGFFTLVGHEIKMADRQRKGVCLLFADLDGFKEVNDTFGHKEGDAALIETSNILKSTFRSSDVIARLGGDEFVVVPVGSSRDCIEAVTARLQKNIDLFNSRSGKGYRISMSIGVACYDPGTPVSIDQLLVQADAQMYDQKRWKKTS